MLAPNKGRVRLEPAEAARFSPSDAMDYNLFRQAVPHHDEFQAQVGVHIRNHIAASTQTSPFLVIEAGTGTGITTEVMLSAGADVAAISIDIDPSMIEQARLNLGRFGSRVSFVEGDILSILKRSSGNSADAFISAYTLHNLAPAYRDQVLAEVIRILKPSGLFINADKIAVDDDQLHRRHLDEQLKSFAIYAAEGRPDVTEYWLGHYAVDERRVLVEGQHHAALKAHGFREIRLVWRQRMEAVILAHK